MFSQLLEHGRRAVAQSRSQVKIPRRAAVRSILIAVMLVTTVAAGPVTGTVSADTTISADCGVDDAIRGTYAVVDPEVDCGLYNNRNEELDKKDVLAQAEGMDESERLYTTTRQNLNQDIRGIMWMKGKAAAIEAMNNGSTEKETKAAFRGAVNDYATLLLLNDLRNYEQRAIELSYMSGEIGGGPSSAPYELNTGTETAWASWDLYNGTTVNVTTPTIIADNGNVYSPNLFPSATGYDRISWNGRSHQTGGNNWVNAVPSDSADSAFYTDPSNAEATAYDTRPLGHLQSTYNDTSGQVIANGEGWITNIYAEYNAGEIPTASLYDPVTLASEASTEYNSTGYYAYRNAELSAIGLSGDVNVSHVIDTQITASSFAQADNQTNASYSSTAYNASIEGTVFISGASDVTLETGQTYDPSTMSGTPYMTVASATDRDTGESIDDLGGTIELTEPFTIDSATNTQTGESVSVTSSQDKNYESVNLTEYERTIDRLRAERNRLENTGPSSSSGATTQESSLFGDLGQFLQTTGGIAILILAGAFIILRGE